MIDDPLVKTLLTNVVEDESNLPIIQALIDGIETDEEIANETGIKLNIVRKILYKLYDMGLASYKRSKDPETQWFTYSWKFETDEVIARIEKDSERYLKMLNDEFCEMTNDFAKSIYDLMIPVSPLPNTQRARFYAYVIIGGKIMDSEWIHFPTHEKRSRFLHY